MEFMNEATKQCAHITTQDEFKKWSAGMKLSDILVRSASGAWWYYTDVVTNIHFD